MSCDLINSGNDCKSEFIYVPVSVGNSVPHKGINHLFQISVCPFTQIRLKIIWRGRSCRVWQNCYWKSKIKALGLTVQLRDGCFKHCPYCKELGGWCIPQLGLALLSFFFSPPKLHFYFITNKISCYSLPFCEEFVLMTLNFFWKKKYFTLSVTGYNFYRDRAKSIDCLETLILEAFFLGDIGNVEGKHVKQKLNPSQISG